MVLYSSCMHADTQGGPQGSPTVALMMRRAFRGARSGSHDAPRHFAARIISATVATVASMHLQWHQLHVNY